MVKSESGMHIGGPIVGESSGGSSTGEFVALPTAPAAQVIEFHPSQPIGSQGASLKGFAETFLQVALDGWYEVIAISKR